MVSFSHRDMPIYKLKILFSPFLILNKELLVSGSCTSDFKISPAASKISIAFNLHMRIMA